jgi:superfamily II DNA/RNA helicase
MCLFELLQIYSEARKYGKHHGLRVACCYGGGSKFEQSKALEAGAEIVIASKYERAAV